MEPENGPPVPLETEPPDGSTPVPTPGPGATDSPLLDPLARTLDRLEAAIEGQRSAASALYVDPLARLLDQVEAATERQSSFWPSAANERLLAAFDGLEKGADGRGPAGPGRQEQDTAASSAALRQEPSFDLSGASAASRSDPPRPWDTRQRGAAFFRPEAQPTYHVMGSGAGIRNDGPGAVWYCNLREEWVSADDCASCSDFEREEDGIEDQEYRCRYAYSGEDEDVQGPERETGSDEQE